MVDITDWNDLDAAIQGTNGSEDTGDYVLQNDLDSSTAGYSGIGDSWQPCGLNATGNFNTGFQGTFDGNGFEIRDLVVDETSHDTTSGRLGLFGSTQGGNGTTVIENLGVRGQITTATDNSSLGFGLLAGLFRDADEVRNCYAEGIVNAPSGERVGGLVGSQADLVTDSYALVDVTGSTNVAGFCGDNKDTIQTSYSAGQVSGDSSVAGFSTTTGTRTETDCYWDTEASGQSTDVGSATGLTTAEMQGSSASTNLSGFDFSGTWDTVEDADGDTSGDGYPILQAITRKTQLQAQGVSLFPATLSGTITQSGSGVENAYVFAYTVPNSNPLGTVLTDTNGDYSFDIAQDDESASVPYEIAVGVDFDDGTDRFGRAKTILFDP